jgi:predicted transcriptional regulator
MTLKATSALSSLSMASMITVQDTLAVCNAVRHHDMHFLLVLFNSHHNLQFLRLSFALICCLGLQTLDVEIALPDHVLVSRLILHSCASASISCIL